VVQAAVMAAVEFALERTCRSKFKEAEAGRGLLARMQRGFQGGDLSG